MKIYIALNGWEYEGYIQPTGAFSTIELARAALNDDKVKGHYQDIFEVELDLPNDSATPTETIK